MRAPLRRDGRLLENARRRRRIVIDSGSRDFHGTTENITAVRVWGSMRLTVNWDKRRSVIVSCCRCHGQRMRRTHGIEIQESHGIPPCAGTKFWYFIRPFAAEMPTRSTSSEAR